MCVFCRTQIRGSSHKARMRSAIQSKSDAKTEFASLSASSTVCAVIHFQLLLTFLLFATVAMGCSVQGGSFILLTPLLVVSDLRGGKSVSCSADSIMPCTSLCSALASPPTSQSPWLLGEEASPGGGGVLQGNADLTPRPCKGGSPAVCVCGGVLGTAVCSLLLTRHGEAGKMATEE